MYREQRGHHHMVLWGIQKPRMVEASGAMGQCSNTAAGGGGRGQVTQSLTEVLESWDFKKYLRGRERERDPIF